MYRSKYFKSTHNSPKDCLNPLLHNVPKWSDSVLIRQNNGQRKPVFWHILSGMKKVIFSEILDICFTLIAAPSEISVATICGALRDLVPFVQFKKCEKHLWRKVTFNEVAGFSLQLY